MTPIASPATVRSTYLHDFHALARPDGPAWVAADASGQSVRVEFPSTDQQGLANRYLNDSIGGVDVTYAAAGPGVNDKPSTQDAIGWIGQLPEVSSIRYEPPVTSGKNVAAGTLFVQGETDRDVAILHDLLRPTWSDHTVVSISKAPAAKE